VRYMQEGGFQQNPLMRLTLGLTLVLLVGFWATNFAMYFSRMGVRPSSVVEYYNGSDEDFRPARSAASMMETTHMHLPMMGLVLLFLTHLVIFVPWPRRAKVAFIVATFGCAAAEEGAGWLVRFVSPAFAPLKVAGFLGLQAAMAVLLGGLAAYLWRGSRRAEMAPADRRVRSSSGRPHEAPEVPAFPSAQSR
jgi:Zn-dependent protease